MANNAQTEPFTIGIEEEYLLVNRQTRELAADPPEKLFQQCAKALPKMVTHEFLRAQIEIGTKVCRDLDEARHELIRLRRTVSEIADQHGLAIIAASSHPSAYWDRPTAHPTRSLRSAGRRSRRGGTSAADLRHARSYRYPRQRSADRSDEPVRLLSAAPAGAEYLVAVLGRRRYRAEIVPAVGVQRAAPYRPARSVQLLVPITSAMSMCWSRPG